MLNQVFYDLELEKIQMGMLRAVEHSKEMQVREFICFLGSFKNRLDTMPVHSYERKDGSVKLSWHGTLMKPWLKVLYGHTKMVGFPEDMLGHFRSALGKKDKYLLSWVLMQTMDVLYSIVDDL
jgi:hypothetical protein